MCAWGDNTHGELGLNTNIGPNTCTNNIPSVTTSCALSAQQVLAGACPHGSNPDLGPAFQISAGVYDALALIGSVPWAGGMVCAWGDGAGGGLGDNSIVDAYVPGPVWGLNGGGYLTTATCISAGDQHGLAVESTTASSPGTLVTWGDEPVTTTGQNGFNGPSWWPVLVPLTNVPGGPNATKVSSISAGSGEWNLYTNGTKGCLLPPPPP